MDYPPSVVLFLGLVPGRRAIHGRGGRVDESGAVKFEHNLKEVFCRGNVVVAQ